MVSGIIGKKIGMTQVFTGEGSLVPVTVVQAGPCTVVQAKMPARDRYAAVQLGFGAQKAQRVSKALRGHVAKTAKGPFRVLREFPVGGDAALEVGQDVRVADVFQAGDVVDVTGVSKGKGTAGVMKRHHFSGFPATHGTHEYFRHGGSIGNRSFPGRVFKGKRMAGRTGNARVTVANLEVVEVRADEDLIFLRGAVPGARGGTVVIRKHAGGKRKAGAAGAE
ncbi:MAG: 50S ribosomal protein L3 [Deltaproteobacteria bacterium]|nr:50S ribosomal protein L3 [Deltaproteobacteria bacterium]